MTSSAALDLSSIREKLKNLRGQKYWRSLEEVGETKEFKDFLHREFSQNASEFRDELGRREFLKLMGASLALAGVTACTRQPLQKIVPYINQPEEVVLGTPLYYATAMPHNGFAQGILVTSWEGHPTKIEGNDQHPVSLGATNVFMQASLLDLYDPDRAQAVTHGMEVSSWGRFLSVLNDAMQKQKAKRGAGLRILSETPSSPTLISQLRAVLKELPEARWHRYQPINRDNVYEGAQLAMGQPVETHYAFEQAEIILALDSDFLFSHPASLQYARKFADGRRLSGGSRKMNRLYAIESAPTITGAMAEHRLAVPPREVQTLALAIAGALGISTGSAQPKSAHGSWVSAVAADLRQHAGASIVIAGESQPPSIHALAHAMNEALGNFGKTISFTAPVEFEPRNQLESLRQLTHEMSTGAVDFLLILGGNPVFAAPADFEFAKNSQRVPLTAHLSSEINETSAACHWHIPETHFLETWSDARAYDGTVSICQPLIEPLYNGISSHEMVAALTQQPVPSAYDIVREYWRKQNSWPEHERSWRTAIHDGWVAGTQLPKINVQMNREEIVRELQKAKPSSSANQLTVNFRADPTLWDGRFANNGWLQELAKPFTKVAWDNPAQVSPALAEQYHLQNGDVVELRGSGKVLRIPVWITPGHADGCATLYLGNGRAQVGRVGTDVGFNTYALRTSEGFWTGEGVALHKTTQTVPLVSTQLFHNVESPERQVLREGTLAEYKNDSQFVQKTVEVPPAEETLFNPGEHAYAGYKWAMAIDLTTCIGCNACILACQSENNIPIVGKTQVGLGRSMQWIRIDSYFKGHLENPSVAHMPVPCMHCENAPCELVCPVGATLHDHEGLNVQVYNRCVGTRFCSNNCPYKVRRFNFLFYAEKDYHTPSLKAMLNPEVTVRWRGVMEKCTYCTQRISAARIASEKENRRIRDGEITPACAQACPARAIVFGDISDANSQVSQQRRQPLNFSMLGELNTRPRTTYLAKLTNPNPGLTEGGLS
ncbi:MAG TPA: TAT-variant-translocated molybdopterin oxidoreductase [Candidatus Saccharimonadales bacterium]|nr:TAT-variant-translocated molybdopterin oxidoreductase [Candidatus Saccharimonadales bacterium]